MTTRRDFLKGFGALLGVAAIVRAPASALATIQRLGTPAEWIGPRTFTTIRSGHWTDPTIWDVGAVPGAGANVVVAAGTVLDVGPEVPRMGDFTMHRATVRCRDVGRLRFSGRIDVLESAIISDEPPDSIMPLVYEPPQPGVRLAGSYVGNIVTTSRDLWRLGFDTTPRALYAAAIAQSPPLLAAGP